MIEKLTAFFVERGVTESIALLLSGGSVLILTILVALFFYLFAEKIVSRIVKSAQRRTIQPFFAELINVRFFRHSALLIPILVGYYASHILLPAGSKEAVVVQQASVVGMIILGMQLINRFLDSAHEIYKKSTIAQRRPIKGYLQITKIILFIVGSILIFNTFLNRSITVILGSLGALSAVLMLVFRDSILGLISGIQVTANDMVRIGDWIEIPSYGADGDVVDINLQTVTIRNWDNTYSTVPIYDLVTGSFKNWRGMTESGGRRIKRSISIDMNTIQFCTEEMLSRFKTFAILQEYIEEREAEIEEYNSHLDADTTVVVNGRRMTNIGCFRVYVTRYLERHPVVNQEMISMVRQLHPGPTGLPIEVYCFSKDKVWVNYEAIQSDIFDHLFAILPEFGLKAYQEPSGTIPQTIELKQPHK